MSPEHRRRIAGRERPEHAAPEPGAPPADPIGKLDEVLATLDRMMEARGPVLIEARRSPPAAEPGEAEDDSIPLLQDVAAPVSGKSATDSAGAFAAARLDGGGDPFSSAPAPVVPPSGLGPPRTPMRFEVEDDPDDDGPRLGDLRLVVGSQPAARDAVLAPDRYGDGPPPALEPEAYRHLVERLANEIDVIVQTGTEEAMLRIAREIAGKVREHVGIVLPEIIEELARMSDDRTAG